MKNLTTLNNNELFEIDGGLIGWIILGGCALIGGFGAGYGLARWLG